jgi:hypothetical protein
MTAPRLAPDVCALLTPPHTRRIVRHGPYGLTTRCECCGATLDALPPPRARVRALNKQSENSPHHGPAPAGALLMNNQARS